MGPITLLFSVFLILGQALCDKEPPIVTVAQGALRGQLVTPDNLPPYYSFLGIPYAKSPVGDLRFKLPGSGPLRAVMVWIHGGGYLKGSGNNRTQSPEFLLSSGIVYVSINYRLGILGFLSTEDEAAPGNAGMKDQVLALRWVQENIVAFGGDPSKVTIFGESAGATSVHYHMLSPMSEGLFRAAIADSGTTSSPRALAENPRKNAFLVGQALGFSGDSSQDLVEFLRSVCSDDLVSTSITTINEEDQYRIMKLYHEVPTVEPLVEGEEAFITENPLNLLDAGKFYNLPYLTGLNADEGIHSLGLILGDGRTLEEIDEEFSKVLKPELMFCREDPCGDEMVAKIRSFYFGDKPVNNTTLQNFIDMCTDLLFAEGSLHGVRTMSELSSQPVYFYQFSYDGALAYFKPNNPRLFNIPGASHADELGYIFGFGTQVAEDSEAAEVRSRMVTMWTNFVKTGKPIPETSAEYPEWLPYKNDATNFMEIGSKLEAKMNYRNERMDFWDELYRHKNETE